METLSEQERYGVPDPECTGDVAECMCAVHCGYVALNNGPSCEACGNDVFELLGRLGMVTWYRCRACGMDEYVRDEEDSDR